MLNDFVIRSNRGSRLSTLLCLWVYTYALFYFVPLIIPSTTMLMYLWLIGIDVLVILNNRSISAKLCIFLLLYSMIALINIAVVSYRYYAAIDAFSGMAVFLPAFLIISSKYFDLKDFLVLWNKYAVIATFLSPIAILLVQNKTIDYGVFTYLNLPNSILFSYNIMTADKGDAKKKISFVLAAVNFLIILAFGGRMAAFAAAFSVLLGYMISSSVKVAKKVFLVMSVGVAGILVINNLNTILQYVQIILSKYNLNSRSYSLLIEQLRTSGAGIYLTRRNIIYEEILDYVKDRAGLPGGFGVALNISDGQFYHPHNLFLQLAVLFGVFGGILFVAFVLYRLLGMKKRNLSFEYQFTLLLLIDYLVISFTGGSILNNFVAVIGMGMVFFYRGKERTIDDSGE